MTRRPAPSQPRAVPASAFPPRVPLWRDPWLAVALLALVLLFVRTLGAPLGEPVADDFDHLRYALFSPGNWLDGGGSRSFWRPLAYQGYYGILHELILTHPVWISWLHLALAALASVLLYDLARARTDGPRAAVVASFPWLLESARALLLVPVHFVDLGLLVFSVVAWHQADRGRRASALAALAAALLCKETAIATALVLPWLARTGLKSSRRAWIVPTALLTLAWAAAYVYVRRHLSLALPHGLEAGLHPGLLWAPERYTWAVSGTLRALMSLPLRSEPRELAALLGALAILGAAGVRFATQPAARARAAAHRPLVLAGLAWFVLASATLLPVHPVWSPERVVYASLGLGASLTLLLAAAHPVLPVLLAMLRVAMFLLAPGAPAHVTREAPDRGAFVDFERLARLQRLMLEARTTLRREFPGLPPGSGVAMLHPPFMADYAAGDRALEVWYRERGLRWLRWDDLDKPAGRTLAGALEFQEFTVPPFRSIEPRALRALFAAGTLHRSEHFQEAIDSLTVADSLQRDREAYHFLGRVQGLRAWCLGATGHIAEAEALARASLAIAPENADGHLTLAAILNGRGEYQVSLAHMDTLLTWYPGYPAALMMRSGILEKLRAQGGVPAPGSPPFSAPASPR